jgi:hypothetical protein
MCGVRRYRYNTYRNRMSKDQWNWYSISMFVHMEDVRKYPNRPWNKVYLSYNENICIDVIRMNLPNSIGEWSWYGISQYIKMEDVINNPNEKWNRGYLSRNENISVEVVNMNLPNATGEWLWYHISSHVKLEDVIKNPNKKWDRYNLSMNKNICIDINTLYPSNSIDGKIDKHRVFDIDILPSLEDHDILSYIRSHGKYEGSSHSLISIGIIDMIDKVGMCKNPDWKYDLDIICLFSSTNADV